MGRPLPYPTQLSPTKRIPVILKPRLQLAILPQLVLHRCSTWSRCLRHGGGGKRRVRVAGAGQAGASRARVLRGGGVRLRQATAPEATTETIH